MEYSKAIKLDFDAESAARPIVNAKQRDKNTRILDIILYRAGLAYTPDSGVPVLFRCERPEGGTVILSSAVNDSSLGSSPVIPVGGNRVIVTLTDEVTQYAGLCLCDICLQSSGRIMSTEAFHLRVHPSPATE